MAAVLSAAGCNNGAADIPIGQRKIRAVATTGMIADLVQQVGGERVEVKGLMGPGVDPHLYTPTYGDREAMRSADVIFHNGLHLEGKMGETFEQMKDRAVAVTSGLDPKTDLRPAPADFEAAHDPHVWFDVLLWMKAIEPVRARLAELDPGHAAEYQANAARYRQELAALHDYVAAQAARVPPSARVLITAHDAFYYFGHRYGFEVRGLQGISTGAEPSLRDVEELAQFIADRRIPAIFVESSVPPKTIEAVQRSVRKKGFEVRIGGELFSDALGNPGTPEGTYVGMVRHNIDTIVRALTRE